MVVSTRERQTAHWVQEGIWMRLTEKWARRYRGFTARINLITFI